MDGTKPRKKGRRTRPVDLAAAVKEAEAVRLRRDGMGLREIAEHLGYADAGGAWKALQRALRATVAEPCEELRELELQRLDWLWETNLKKAKAGTIGAVLAANEIIKTRAKLLGLNSPDKHRHELTGKGGEALQLLVVDTNLVRAGESKPAPSQETTPCPTNPSTSA